MRADFSRLWDFLGSYFQEIAGDEFHVSLIGLPSGAGGVRNAATRLLSEALGLAVAAECESDADLLIFNDWAMPILQARSWLSTPVTGVAEGSVILGNVLGRRPAIVTVGKGLRWDMERDVRVFGLMDHFAAKPVWWLDPESSQEDVLRAVDAPGELIDRFDRVAKAAADSGADAILVGCGSYSPIFTRAGYTHVGGRSDVPVLDCCKLALEMGKSLVSLKAAGLTPSGAGFEQPGERARDVATRVLERLNRT